MTDGPSASVGEALPAAVDAIAAAGSETARLDAELLLCEATGWDRARINAEPSLRLPVGASREFAQMVRRRVRREPVAYILGRKGFRHIEVIVDPRVLIPRPETELLAEIALELAPRTVLDVGTGSGAIALAIADELPHARITAIDTSLDALRVAQTNVDRLGLGERVDVVAAGVASLPSGRHDLLVANLPYVSEGEWETLEPEIRDYEPREALVPGPTGLEAIEGLLAAVTGSAERPGAVLLEVGAGQSKDVVSLVRDAGFDEVETRRDLGGQDRAVFGR
jgi:release factor glutamine methyltransferase